MAGCEPSISEIHRFSEPVTPEEEHITLGWGDMSPRKGLILGVGSGKRNGIIFVGVNDAKGGLEKGGHELSKEFVLYPKAASPIFLIHKKYEWQALYFIFLPF